MKRFLLVNTNKGSYGPSNLLTKDKLVYIGDSSFNINDYITPEEISNWNTAYGWGDFREYGLGTIKNIDGQNLNELAGTGFYVGTSMPNAPDSEAWFIQNYDNNSHKFQFAFEKPSSNLTPQGYFYRVSVDLNWGPWILIPTKNTVDSDVDSSLSNYQLISQKGQAGGYVPLDGGIKIPSEYLPDSLMGQVEYIGTWNASTNSPTLSTTDTPKGHYYITTVGGTFDGINFAPGDWIISNGTQWDKIDNTDAVTSIFGRLGNIVAQESDYESFYPKLTSNYVNPTWLGSLSWSKITDTPTTLFGYGITDTHTKLELGNIFSGSTTINGYNKTNWDTAFSWGDHGSVGYATEFQLTNYIQKWETWEGTLNVNGSIIPTVDDVYTLGSPTHAWKDLYVGPGSLYVNGKKVIEDVSNTMNFTTSIDQNLSIKTSGIGNIQISTLDTGNVELVAPQGLIQLKGSVMFQGGKLIRSSDGTNLLVDDSIQFSAGEGVKSDLPVTGDITANKLIKSGGLSSQFLKADGSVDTNIYITGINNITDIPNRDYGDLTGKPDLSNQSNWDTAYSWGNFRDYGLGIITPQGVGIPGGNLNSITIPNGFYKITTSTLNSPIGGESGTVIIERSGLDNYITQKVQMTNAGDVVKSFIRHYKPATSTWTPWRRLWTTEDFTITNVGNWNISYGWGNHSDAGYLKTETDPIFSASPSAGITETNKTNWNSAFSWGNHSLVGYLTSLPTHNHDTENDVRYVKKAGDTMTGPLNITTSSISDLMTLTSNGKIRTSIDQWGRQLWYINSGNAEVGRITYTSPGGMPGIVFFDNAGNSRSQMVLKSGGGIGFGSVSGSTTPVNHISLNNNGTITSNGFVKSGGVSSQFLKADGSVDSSTYITGITVSDDNINTTKHQIATVEGIPLYETVGEILQPVLEGNILHIKYKDGDGVIQSQPVDLSTLVFTANSISNATYNAATNVITLSEDDGTIHTIDLSEFSIVAATDANGVTTLTQEGVVKLTSSKVGQTGQWNDILGKPTTFTPSAHHHDGDYVKKVGDTMTGPLSTPRVNIGTDSYIREFDGTDTDISSLVGGSAAGTLMKGRYQGHFVLKLDANDTNESFSVVRTIIGNAGADTNANAMLMQVKATGDTTFFGKIIKSGGTASQFLKADGSVDETNYAVANDYVKIIGDTMTGPLVISDVSTPGQTVFDIHGSAGQLFSITDSLEGDLFSVNDISGLPILTVNSNDRVEVNGVLEVKTSDKSGLTTDTTLNTLDASLYHAAHFDYVIKREDALGMRTGTVMAVWNGTDIEYTDTGVGSNTDYIDLSVDIFSGEVNLKATITSGTWSIKVGARTL